LYAKCGAPEQAREAFDELAVRNEASWTALIAGYARHGRGKAVVELFDGMIEAGIEPSCATYAIVLCSCSHSGLVEKGQMYFEKMSTDHGIVATAAHYTCMLDLFGRAGQFGKVVAIISQMPDRDQFPEWASLLGSCKTRGHVELARVAFRHLLRLDADCEAAYVCMINMYLERGMRSEAMQTEALRMGRKARCAGLRSSL
jgi:pentatricopeptide repeat protein